MRQLHVVSLSEDGRFVLLAPSRGGATGTFKVALDAKLAAAVRGELPRPGQSGPPPSSVTPKEIQARLRAGESVEDIARAAGVPVARIERFAGPVVSERAGIVEAARAAVLQRSRRGTSAVPLGDAVDAHLAETAGLDPESVRWTTRRRDDGRWEVEVAFTARGRRKRGCWVYDPARKELSAVDASSSVLGFVEPEDGGRPGKVVAAAPRTAARRPARRTSRAAAPQRSAAAAVVPPAARRPAAAEKAAGTAASTSAKASRAEPTPAKAARATPTKAATTVARTAAPPRSAGRPGSAAAGRTGAASAATRAASRQAATARTAAAGAAPRTASRAASRAAAPAAAATGGAPPRAARTGSAGAAARAGSRGRRGGPSPEAPQSPPQLRVVPDPEAPAKRASVPGWADVLLSTTPPSRAADGED